MMSVLATRSAVPAVFSRPNAAPAPKHLRVSHNEKERLLRMARRKKLGPLDSVTDTGAMAAEPSEAVKQSGKYDVWSAKDEQEEEFKKVIVSETEQEFIRPIVVHPAIKPPTLKRTEKTIELAAIVQPHPGTSYNPSLDSHQQLLRTAHEVEARREAEADKYRDVKTTMEAARRAVTESDVYEGAPGMIVDVPGEDDEDSEGEDDIDAEAVRMPGRKTKQKKRKSAEVLEEKRAAAERVAKKRMLASILHVKTLRKTIEGQLSSRDRAVAERKAAREGRFKDGLAGERFGKHKVVTGEIDVQLGDELVETLRELKPEGNLFRDRFLSLQHRGLLEPRKRVTPKRKNKVKEYEKHPWKRFDRTA